MTATSTAAAGPQGFFDGTLGCPNTGADQAEGCLGIQPENVARLAVIPVGNTTQLAWARTSKANPDEAFFAMFEKMPTAFDFADEHTSASRRGQMLDETRGVTTMTR